MTRQPTGSSRPAVRAGATLEQVAARAGVSLKTASRALNGEPHVADDTRAKVVKAARLLGFQPNQGASMLARGVRSNMAALVTGDLANPFYSALAAGMEQELRAGGVQLTVASSEEDPGRERELIAEQVARQVRALLLVSTEQDHRHLAAVQARVPIIFVDRCNVGVEADSVVLDNRGGSVEATEHLIARGHRDIAYVGDYSRLATNRERFEGFAETMRRHGLDPERSTRHDAHSVGAARHAVRELADRPTPPTAFFTSNNRITVGALHELADKELKPALVGFDDFELADLLGISVIAHDPVEMGRRAAILVRERLETGRSQPVSIVIETHLAARASGNRPGPGRH